MVTWGGWTLVIRVRPHQGELTVRLSFPFRFYSRFFGDGFWTLSVVRFTWVIINRFRWGEGRCAQYDDHAVGRPVLGHTISVKVNFFLGLFRCERRSTWCVNHVHAFFVRYRDCFLSFQGVLRWADLSSNNFFNAGFVSVLVFVVLIYFSSRRSTVMWDLQMEHVQRSTARRDPYRGQKYYFVFAFFVCHFPRRSPW